MRWFLNRPTMKRFYFVTCRFHWLLIAFSGLLVLNGCGGEGRTEADVESAQALPEEPAMVRKMAQRYAQAFHLHNNMLKPAEREVVADALAAQWSSGGQLEEDVIAEFSATLDYFARRAELFAEKGSLPPAEERRLVLAGRYIGGLGPLDLLALSEQEEAAFWEGLQEGFSAQRSQADYEVLRAEVKAWTGQRRAALAGEIVAANEMEASEHFEKLRLDPAVRERPSGLFVRMENSGSGRSPGPLDRVVVHYRGKLLDGREFDSSFKRGESAEFAMNQVIPGFTEGLSLMREGGQATLTIPSHLAYGLNAPRGSIITPGAALVFEIQLLEVLPAR